MPRSLARVTPRHSGQIGTSEIRWSSQNNRPHSRVTQRGLVCTSIRNLQIVNGGQTTASLHAASRAGEDLRRVFVQLKLSIVDQGIAEAVVPRISEYANSQNKVNAADFFSNHPFHVRMEDFSRRIFAPPAPGALHDTKWFYERARGQYQDLKSGATAAQKKKFDLQFPKAQVFSKTDLAKYEGVWAEKPHIVSRGAQKNFADFAATVGAAWEKESDIYNEEHFRELVAKAIVFRHLEKEVPKQNWYAGGYRANIIAYGISKLAHDLRTEGKQVDFQAIWRSQHVSRGLSDALVLSCARGNDVLVAADPSARNVTEWAKKEACWTTVARLVIEWPKTLEGELLTKQAAALAKKRSVDEQKDLNLINAQARVVEAGPDIWRQALAWGKRRGHLTDKDQGVLTVCGQMPTKVPSDKQAVVALEALHRLHQEGCMVGRDILRPS